MISLSIETSCDETSLALLFLDLTKIKTGNENFVDNQNQIKVLSHITSTQIDLHKKYGGVVPEVGAREHAEQIHFLLEQILIDAKDKIESNSNLILNFNSKITSPTEILKQLDCIFVTVEPGLPSALRVGVEFAKSLQFFIKKKYNKELELKPVNHLRGHVASAFYDFDNNLIK
jgi:N6-L-threonylcarbamoyladenine synthase